jgi:membrane fusion protein, multidrug efflux system
MSPTELTEHEQSKALPKPTEQHLLADPEQPKGSPARTIIVILVVLLAVGGAVWKIRQNASEQTTQGSRQAAAADRPIPVTVRAVEQKTMPIYLTELGTVTAYNTVTIKTRVDGQLIEVPVREGQKVTKGQLLAQIDPAPYAAAVAQAEGTLVKDEATAANAQAEATRYTALYQAGVVSKESQQSQVSGAGQAEGSIAADKAAIQAAKVNLAYTKITSPIDGVVGLRQVDPGNIVHASDATGLLLVTQLQPIAVIFTLPEDQLPQVQAVMKAGGTLAVEAYDRSNTTHVASGKLLTLDNQIDPTTGTVKAKAVFDNKDQALFPNQFVNVRLILQDRPNAIVVPAAALQTGAQGSFVFVVKPGQPPANADSTGGGGGATAGGGRRRSGGGGAGGSTKAGGQAGQGDAGPPAAPYYVEARTVTVDITEGAQVILSSGLAAGEQVVVDGQEKLKNYSRVTPKDANAPAGGRQKGKGGANGASGTGTGSGTAAPGTTAPSGAPAGTTVPGNKSSGPAASGADSNGGQHHRQGGNGAGNNSGGVQP